LPQSVASACEELCDSRWAASADERAGARPAGVGTLAFRATRSRQWIVPGKAGLEVVTGTIGARRAWTVSMISCDSVRPKHERGARTAERRSPSTVVSALRQRDVLPRARSILALNARAVARPRSELAFDHPRRRLVRGELSTEL
jgi:hypothetical protein